MSKKGGFKYFFIKSLIFLAIIIILDYTAGAVLRYYYFKQKSGLQYRTTYSIDETKADLLVFGSSKANHHYVPGDFEKRLSLSYYNVGRDGNCIFYHYAVLKGILKRYTPKIIILDLAGFEFGINQDGYDRLSSLLPYYKSHPEIRPIIELKGPYEKIKLLSGIYPFNSSALTITIGNTEANKKRNEDIKGYIPLKKTWGQPAKYMGFLPSYDLDSNKLKTFESFIKDCKAANVKLYIVVSPDFLISDNFEYSFALGKETAQKNGISFFDFSRDTNFLNKPALFADAAHLNDEGAKIFSNAIVDSMARAK